MIFLMGIAYMQQYNKTLSSYFFSRWEYALCDKLLCSSNYIIYIYIYIYIYKCFKVKQKKCIRIFKLILCEINRNHLTLVLLRMNTKFIYLLNQCLQFLATYSEDNVMLHRYKKIINSG